MRKFYDVDLDETIEYFGPEDTEEVIGYIIDEIYHGFHNGATFDQPS